MRLATFLALFLAVLSAAQAQVLVRKDVADVPAVDLTALAAAGPAGAVFRSVLEADLRRSGWVEVAAGGAYPVRGAFADPASVRCEVVDTGAGKIVLSRSFSQAGGDVRRLAHEVADAIVFAVTGRRGMASARLVASGRMTGAWELYLCDADGTNLRRLTNDRTISIFPSWAPDGARIVYTSFRSRYPDLYVINLGSSSRELLSNFPGLNSGPAFSPDGGSLALTLSKDGNPELYIMRPAARGGRLTRLTTTQAAAETSASWAPDGNSLVFVSDSSGSPQLYVMGRSGGERKRITTSGSENVSPDWGSNGWITYSSRREGRYQVCVYNPSTGEAKQLTGDGADYEDPTWAPDGRHIACTRTQSYRSAIYVLDMLTGTSVALLTVEGGWRSAAWSPR